jgi:putative FmdB family regulatory protein
MPTYDFECSRCGEEDVVRIPYEDRDLARQCPTCLGEEMTMIRTWKKMPGTTRASFVDGHRREAVTAHRATRAIETAMESGELNVKTGAQEIFNVRTKGTGGSKT